MRSDRGQTAADLLGVLLIVAAVGTTGVGDRIKTALAAQVDCLGRGEGDCADDPPTVTEDGGELNSFYSHFDGARGALLDELNDPSTGSPATTAPRRGATSCATTSS